MAPRGRPSRLRVGVTLLAAVVIVSLPSGRRLGGFGANLLHSLCATFYPADLLRARRPLLASPLVAVAAVVATGGLHVQPAAASLFGMRDDLPAPSDAAAPLADAEVTRSGLAFKVLKPPACAPAACERPTPYDRVVVDYTGWQTSGKMFDSSVSRGQPATFGMREVIRGWTEGLQLMSPGEKRRFWIPSALAYGDSPGAGRPGGALVFDVELLRIEVGKRPPPAPPDVAAPPAEALRTASGLASRRLLAGKGEQTPKPDTKVTVMYNAWKADGEFLVSGGPATFTAKDAILKGLGEGVQLMVPGEIRRIWIPGSLAYGEKPKEGLPAGMLVFDVRLLEIN